MAASLNPLDREVAPAARHTPRSGRATDREQRPSAAPDQVRWRMAAWQLLTPEKSQIE